MEISGIKYIDLDRTPMDSIVKCTPFIAAAVEHSLGESSLSDVIADIMAKRMLVWVVLDKDEEIVGVFGGHVLQYPRFNALFIKFLGGTDFESWVGEAAAVAQRWAESTGCAVIEMAARKGFKKIASRFGYSEVYRVYSKTLTGDAAIN